ncbi:hypothetical protein [Carboxydothermus ferrireducens]|uniref:Ethanolamine utilization cobalamin adenosyltransferase n=1 Tax=Carboxydothermus ferrireducens DSM 11255 TaxID=1119529 RepID=A0ABX2RBU1_9THEO|nr:hypothetical protein [Carboxydothermus ferrireducens]NYE58485.1 ethanolamine utilization cobalamin adenosyltransferase [Carboxydothermus ferrireducens DSM 11255]
MRIITEIELRDEFKKRPMEVFEVPENTKLTPAALQFLNERKIKIIWPEEKEKGIANNKIPEKAGDVVSQISKNEYVVLETGEKLDYKPESMTHLRGRYLVPKNHPRIKFRGKLDSFESLLIYVIEEAKNCGYKALVNDLWQLLDYAKKIMKAEVQELPLEELDFNGMTEAEIRARSHNPRKYYHIDHLIPSPGQGRMMALLNLLRTNCRELELAAVDAFLNQNDFREDILQSLNRMSSLIYVIMLQLAAGYYKVDCHC